MKRQVLTAVLDAWAESPGGEPGSIGIVRRPDGQEIVMLAFADGRFAETLLPAPGTDLVAWSRHLVQTLAAAGN